MGYMQLFNTKASIADLNQLSTKTVYGSSMPRGRIYDRNYNVIVDNVGVNLISYKRESGMTTKDEVSIAYKLAEKLDVDYSALTDTELRRFWIINNEEEAYKRLRSKDDTTLAKYEELKSSINSNYYGNKVESYRISKNSERSIYRIVNSDKKTIIFYVDAVFKYEVDIV